MAGVLPEPHVAVQKVEHGGDPGFATGRRFLEVGLSFGFPLGQICSSVPLS